METHRIIRADNLNWAIQSWQPGGDIVERGRFAGRTKQSKWKAPHAFFCKLEHAASHLINEELAEGWTGKDLAVAVKAAEANVVEFLRATFAEQRTDVLIGILQERGYTITDGTKGKLDYGTNQE